MSLTLALGATSYLYSKKVERDVENLLEEGEYEELVEVHHSSRDFGDILPSSYEEFREKAGSLENTFSAAKGAAYRLALDEDTIDSIYRGFSKEMDVEEYYEYL